MDETEFRGRKTTWLLTPTRFVQGFKCTFFQRHLIWIFRCYRREKPPFLSHPCWVADPSLHIFRHRSQKATISVHINPPVRFRSIPPGQSASWGFPAVNPDGNTRLFLVLVLVCERAERREVKFCFLRAALPPSGRVAGAAKQGTGSKTPDLERQNKNWSRKPRIWSRKTGTGAANPDLEPQNKELEPQTPDLEPQNKELEAKNQDLERKQGNWSQKPGSGAAKQGTGTLCRGGAGLQ